MRSVECAAFVRVVAYRCAWVSSGITCIRTDGVTDILPVNGRLCAAIRAMAAPPAVAKMAMMSRL